MDENRKKICELINGIGFYEKENEGYPKYPFFEIEIDGWNEGFGINITSSELCYVKKDELINLRNWIQKKLDQIELAEAEEKVKKLKDLN